MFSYGMKGDDVLYGEGQDDDLIGGWGNDWLSGGSGDDGLLGDDGRIYTSRNGIAEPLYAIGSLQGQLDLVIYTPGKIQTAIINVSGELKKTFHVTPFNLDPETDAQDTQFDPIYADDVMYGGLGNDFMHGGAGDDAMSGAEALDLAAAGLPSIVQPSTTVVTVDADSLILSGYNRPYNPGNLLRFNPIDVDGQHTDQRTRAGEFALYDEYDPLRKIIHHQRWAETLRVPAQLQRDRRT